MTLTASVVTPLGACTQDVNVQDANLEIMRGSVRVDGSSTVYPITEAVAEEFRKVAPRVRVTVGVSGTGGGFKRFTIGETDVSDASRPIKKEENAIAGKNEVEYLEIPVAYDGLSIVVNPKNDWCKTLTIDDLKRIFLARNKDAVQTWKDVNGDWPAEEIKIFAPGTDSGTFDYFKEVVAGKGDAIRDDMSVSEDDNVLVRGVAGEKGGIGFFGCAYYFENKDKIRAVGIDGGKGPVLPNHDTIESGTYAPFSRPLFIYLSNKSLARPEVRAFAEFYMKRGPALAEEVGYVQLPKALYQKAKQKYDARKTGTHFLDDKGEKKHGPLSEIYR